MKRFICLMFLIVCSLLCALPNLKNEGSENYTVVYAEEAPTGEETPVTDGDTPATDGETPATDGETTDENTDNSIEGILGSGQIIENNIVFWVAFGLGIFTLGFYLIKVISSYKKGK